MIKLRSSYFFLLLAATLLFVVQEHIVAATTAGTSVTEVNRRTSGTVEQQQQQQQVYDPVVSSSSSWWSWSWNSSSTTTSTTPQTFLADHQDSVEEEETVCVNTLENENDQDVAVISEASYRQESRSPKEHEVEDDAEDDLASPPQAHEEQEDKVENERDLLWLMERGMDMDTNDNDNDQDTNRFLRVDGSDFGVIQDVNERTPEAPQMFQLLQDTISYMNAVVRQDPDYVTVRENCRNQHELCTYWAVLGECENNPSYMKLNCAPVCHSCEMLDIRKRCPLDLNSTTNQDVLAQPGDLNNLFYNVMTNPALAQFTPQAVSYPAEYAHDPAIVGDGVVGDDENANTNTKVKDGPWLILLENVVTPEEAGRLRELGAAQGYQRSEDVGKRKADGTYGSYSNSGRTSTNAWCIGDCYTDPLAQRVMERISNITGGIPDTNSENLQLLRYEPNQFYQTHSDYIPFQRERQSGVRILTFYIYLNDVEEGGGTNFPHIHNVTVTPKLGRAALWPSVLNAAPNQIDSRTEHQALPVVRGTKYGANAWIHQRDYKGPNAVGC